MRITVALADSSDGDDTYEGPACSFMTEPSGALVIFERPNLLWAAYAPSVWKQVNCERPD